MVLVKKKVSIFLEVVLQLIIKKVRLSLNNLTRPYNIVRKQKI